MAGLIEKIKNFFTGKFVCKVKKDEEPKPQQEESKPEESKREESSSF